MSVTATRAIGAAIDRLEGRAKVTGQAKYAYEYRHRRCRLRVILPSTIAKGAVRNVDAAAALALPGVHAVLWHGNAPRLHEVADGELKILQSDRIAYRGQIVAAVIADSYETARQAERLIRIEYAPGAARRAAARPTTRSCTRPEKVNPNYPGGDSQGDFDGLSNARSRSTARTRRPPSTTTRWSRTPRSRSGTRTRVTHLRLEPRRRQRQEHRGARVRARARTACG